MRDKADAVIEMLIAAVLLGVVAFLAASLILSLMV